MSTERTYTDLSSELAEVLDRLSEWEDNRRHLAQQLVTVRTLLKTADADLTEERRRHPVCRCCGDPIPSAELLEAMERAAPIGRLLTADATDLWAAGFCSSKCEQDFADAGPSEPGRCSQCHSGAPERAGHLAKADGHFEYVGAISDVMKQLRDAREKTR